MGKLVKDPAGGGTGLLNGSSEETRVRNKKKIHTCTIQLIEVVGASWNISY